MTYYVCVSPGRIGQGLPGIVVVDPEGRVTYHDYVKLRDASVVQDVRGLRRRLGIKLTVDPMAWVETAWEPEPVTF